MLIRLQALGAGPVSAMSGLETEFKHRFNLAKPGSSEHDPDFPSGEVKRITGLSEPIETEPAFQNVKIRFWSG